MKILVEPLPLSGFIVLLELVASTGNCELTTTSDLNNLTTSTSNDQPEAAASPIRVKRIVNGTLAPPSNFPYHVAIMLVTGLGLGDLSYLCGGAILAPDWVLTAAHCVTDLKHYPTFVVVAGTTRPTGSSDLRKQYRVVGRVHVHPGYNSSTIENDLALLWLPSALELKPGFVEPATVANGSVGRGKAVIAGWGQTSTILSYLSTPSRQDLRYVRVELFSPRLCSHVLSSNFEFQYDAALVLCAMGDGNSGVCFGDSGSPVVDSKTKNLIGIVSFGLGSNETCSVDQPTFLVRVSAYMDWILGFCENCLSVAAEPEKEQLEMEANKTPEAVSKHGGRYAFQVLITRREEDPNLESSCTGSIIAQRWVLTSARCLAELGNFTSTVYVRPATTGIGEDLAPVVMVELVHQTIGDGYGVALLYTGMDFSWPDWARVRLGLEDPQEGATAELLSWSQYPQDTEYLYYAFSTISILSNSFCIAVHPSFEPESMVCAMEETDFRYCIDHLGTPVMQNGEQIGMVTGYDENEEGECFADFPMVVTRISVYVDWIQEACGNCLNSTDAEVGVSSSNGGNFKTAFCWQLLGLIHWIPSMVYLWGTA